MCVYCHASVERADSWASPRFGLRLRWDVWDGQRRTFFWRRCGLIVQGGDIGECHQRVYHLSVWANLEANLEAMPNVHAMSMWSCCRKQQCGHMSILPFQVLLTVGQGMAKGRRSLCAARQLAHCLMIEESFLCVQG